MSTDTHMQRHPTKACPCSCSPLSPSPTPQVDRQAEDRCHRLGQTRKVTVYRLVCDNTVDAGEGGRVRGAAAGRWGRWRHGAF